MSNFLGFESPLIPLGYSIQQTQDTIETALSSRGMRILRRGKPPQAALGTITNPTWALNMADNHAAAGSATVAVTLGVQMAAPFTPTQFILDGASDANTTAPRNFTLDYSDDGAAWTTLQTWTNEQNWTPLEARKYAVAGAAAHAYWRLNVTLANGGGTYISGFYLEDANGTRATYLQFLDVIPPATEAVGNADAMDVLRIVFATTLISFRALQYTVAGVPQTIALWQKTGGAVAGALTINGTTVTGPVGAAGNTAQQNLRALYETIRASADANFTDWNWEYQKPAAQNSNDGNDYIYATRKTIGNNLAISPNANVNAATIGSSYPANMPQNVNISSPYGVSSDLTNGFIYYLQVCARGIALATKTTSGFSTPIHACWGTNAKAVAAVPATGWGLKCTPIELMIGYDDVAGNTGSFARGSHTWGMSSLGATSIQPINTNYYGGTPFGKATPRDKVFDASVIIGSTFELTMTLAGSNMFFSTSEGQSGVSTVADDFQVHRMSTVTERALTGGFIFVGNASSSGGVVVSPALEIQDWYKFMGSATDEALLLVADTVAICRVASNVAAGDATINVDSTAGFQTAGFVVLENEVIQYTGITGTSFTGCTRAKYATVATAHFSGDAVNQGLWFVKILGGALFAGYVKPI